MKRIEIDSHHSTYASSGQRSLWARMRGALILGTCVLQLILCAAAYAQCNEVRSGDTVWVRLIRPLSSYSSKRGDPVRAIVMEAPRCDGVELVPEGAEIDGRIEKVMRV